MESRAKFLGHSVHQMLIPVPAGLFIVAALLDVVGRFADWTWVPTVTYWNIALGIAAALVAAVFGAVDWTKIPAGTRAKRVGTFHGISNVIAVITFAIALALRTRSGEMIAGNAALTLELIALAIVGVAGWLGGELVDRLGVGIDEGAHLNAPSSLRVKNIVDHRN